MITANSSELNNTDNFSSLINLNKVSNTDSHNLRQKCGYCSSTFTSQQELVSHLKIHTFICIECDQTFYNKKSLELHMSRHNSKKKWVCKFCNKPFSFRSLLEQHSRSHSGLKPFKCDKCGRSYSRLFNLQIHKRRHLTNGTFDCSQWPQKFSHPGNLSKHLRHVHVTSKAHKCVPCPMDFSDLQSFDQHINSHPSTEIVCPMKSFPCQFCQEVFTAEDKLSQHLDTHAHADENSSLDKNLLQVKSKKDQFQCKICLKPFSKLANLNNHHKCHSENVKQDHFCKLCPNQKFASEELLLQHKKSVHKIKTPFVCEYCQKEFLFQSLLTQHLRKHTGEKPFCCPHCNKSYVRLFNMKMHLKLHKNWSFLSSEKTVQMTRLRPQNRTECNDTNRNRSYEKLKNNPNFEENTLKINNLHNEPHTLSIYENTNCEKMYQPNSSLFENVSLNQENIPHFIHYNEDLVNQSFSKYEENLPAISQLTSSWSIDPNARVEEKENENKVTTFKNFPSPSDSAHYLNENNYPVSSNQCAVSLTHVDEGNMTSVAVSENETKKHSEGSGLPFESLLGSPSNSLNGITLSNNQCALNNQSDNLMTPFKELIVIPVTDSSNDDKISKNSYVINLETDLQSQITGSEEELPIYQPYLGDSHMTTDQISTDAVAANNSRVLQYLNSQSQELNSIEEPNRKNFLSETTAMVSLESAESDLINFSEENHTKTNIFFTCLFCKDVFLSAKSLNDHIKLHTIMKPFVCGYCQKSFRYSSLLTQHIKQHKQQVAASFNCNQCSKCFSNRNLLVLHQQMHKKLHNKSKETQLKCMNSDNNLDIPDDLCHLGGAYPKNVDNKSDDPSNTELWRQSTQTENRIEQKNSRLLSCEFCGKIFRYQSLLNQHLHRHTGKKPFTCSICRKSFARLFNLKVHQKQHLKRLSPLPSEKQSKNNVSSTSSDSIVPFPFVKPSKITASSPASGSVVSLPLVKQSRMTVSSPSLASVALFPFVKESKITVSSPSSAQKRLLLTKRQNTTKNKKLFEYNSGNQSFVKGCDLWKPRQQHKRFICEFCKKDFHFYSLLVQHLPTHTGEKAFPCEICKKSYTRLFNLKIHQQKCVAKKISTFMIGTN